MRLSPADTLRHDVRVLLSVVVSYAELVGEELPSTGGSQLREGLELVDHGGRALLVRLAAAPTPTDAGAAGAAALGETLRQTLQPELDHLVERCVRLEDQVRHAGLAASLADVSRITTSARRLRSLIEQPPQDAARPTTSAGPLREP